MTPTGPSAQQLSTSSFGSSMAAYIESKDFSYNAHVVEYLVFLRRRVRFSGSVDFWRLLKGLN